jgi:hypothetical protein
MAGQLTIWRKDRQPIGLDFEAVSQYLLELFDLIKIPDIPCFERTGLRVDLQDFTEVVSVSFDYYEGRLKDEYPTDPLLFLAVLFCIQGFDPNVELEMYAAEGSAGYPDRSTPFSEASSIRDVCDFLRIPKGGSNASKLPPV